MEIQVSVRYVKIDAVTKIGSVLQNSNLILILSSIAA